MRVYPESPSDLQNHACLAYKGTGGAQCWYFRPPSNGNVQIIEVKGKNVRVVWEYFLDAIGSPPYWNDLGDSQ